MNEKNIHFLISQKILTTQSDLEILIAQYVSLILIVDKKSG